RRQNALQIQRIGTAKRNQLAIWRCLANGTQQADGLRPRKLFAAGFSHKIAPANLPARLPAAINSPQLIPRNWETLASEQTAKDHAVPMEQHPRKLLDCLGARGTFRTSSPKKSAPPSASVSNRVRLAPESSISEFACVSISQCGRFSR